MSQNLNIFYAQQFKTLVQLKLQQKMSKFRSCMTEGSYTGSDKASPVNQVGKVVMQPVTSRFAAKGRVDAPMDRRWVSPSDFDLNQLVDFFDQIKAVTDAKSALVENALMAANRQIDDLFVDAIFGTAKTGVAGATSVAFSSFTGQIVAVDFEATGEVGMTVSKLRKARHILRAAEVDLENEEIYCAIGSQQEEDLLKEAQVVSLDYNERPVLVDGKLNSYLGFKFVHSERLDLVSSDNRQCAVWAKSGMHLGIWDDLNTSISQRNDLSGEPWQAYLKMSMGVTRLEEEKIVQILCDE